jgi:hypothetical protein
MDNSKQRGGKRIGAGRPPKSIEHRKLFKGKIAVRVSPESALLAQRLMLHFPEIRNVEGLYEYALNELAKRTDD